MIKSAVKYILIFVLVLLLLLGILVSAALIPRDDIRPQMMESAELLTERPMFFPAYDNLISSEIDRYADSITLSTAYHFDPEHPLQSTMLAARYHDGNESLSFYTALQENPPANQEYLRYWHGSTVPVTFMHLFWNLRQIYNFHAVLMAALLLLLLVLLLRARLTAQAIGLLFSLAMVSPWFVHMSLEYTYAFLCMLIFSIIGVWLALRDKRKLYGPMFLISGMVTVYFDFLTTETLSLTIPLLLMLSIQFDREATAPEAALPAKAGQSRSYAGWFLSLKACALWLIGYCGMWVMKWILASKILGIDVRPYITGHVEEWTIGDGSAVTNHTVSETLERNLGCLFPFEYGSAGLIITAAAILLLIILPLALKKVSVQPPGAINSLILYLVIGLIPVIRISALHNHAFRHYFFTYRALAAGIFALFLIALLFLRKNENRN